MLLNKGNSSLDKGKKEERKKGREEERKKDERKEGRDEERMRKRGSGPNMYYKTLNLR